MAMVVSNHKFGVLCFSANVWSFYINLPIGATSAAIILLSFKSPKSSRHEASHNFTVLEKIKQIDLIGTLLIMSAIICLLLALQWGGVSKSWKSSDVIGTLVGFGVIAIVFVTYEVWQGERGMLMPHILRRREVRIGCMFMFLYVSSLRK